MMLFQPILLVCGLLNLLAPNQNGTLVDDTISCAKAGAATAIVSRIAHAASYLYLATRTDLPIHANLYFPAPQLPSSTDIVLYTAPAAVSVWRDRSSMGIFVDEALKVIHHTSSVVRSVLHELLHFPGLSVSACGSSVPSPHLPPQASSSLIRVLDRDVSLKLKAPFAFISIITTFFCDGRSSHPVVTAPVLGPNMCSPSGPGWCGVGTGSSPVKMRPRPNTCTLSYPRGCGLGTIELSYRQGLVTWKIDFFKSPKRWLRSRDELMAGVYLLALVFARLYISYWNFCFRLCLTWGQQLSNSLYEDTNSRVSSSRDPSPKFSPQSSLPQSEIDADESSEHLGSKITNVNPTPTPICTPIPAPRASRLTMSPEAFREACRAISGAPIDHIPFSVYLNKENPSEDIEAAVLQARSPTPVNPIVTYSTPVLHAPVPLKWIPMSALIESATSQATSSFSVVIPAPQKSLVTPTVLLAPPSSVGFTPFPAAPIQAARMKATPATRPITIGRGECTIIDESAPPKSDPAKPAPVSAQAAQAQTDPESVIPALRLSTLLPKPVPSAIPEIYFDEDNSDDEDEDFEVDYPYDEDIFLYDKFLLAFGVLVDVLTDLIVKEVCRANGTHIKAKVLPANSLMTPRAVPRHLPPLIRNMIASSNIRPGSTLLKISDMAPLPDDSSDESDSDSDSGFPVILSNPTCSAKRSRRASITAFIDVDVHESAVVEDDYSRPMPPNPRWAVPHESSHECRSKPSGRRLFSPGLSKSEGQALNNSDEVGGEGGHKQRASWDDDGKN